MEYYEVKKNETFEKVLNDKIFGKYFYPVQNRKDTFLFTSHTFKYCYNFFELGEFDFKKKTMSSSIRNSLKKRLHFSIKSYLEDPVPEIVLNELLLILKTRPDLKIEYLGRDRSPVVNNNSLNLNFHKTFFLDRINGNRHYNWKIYPLKHKFPHNDADHAFKDLKKWFNDPDAKVILCLGGGGARLFAIPTVFKLIDLMDVRSCIDEIWGSSGGSIAGSLYSYGLSPQFIERFGYALYNEKYPDVSSKPTLVQKAKAVAVNCANKLLSTTQLSFGIPESFEILRESLEEINKKSDSLSKKIPFYALATNLSNHKMHALCEKNCITEPCKAILKECSHMDAVFASSAIPFVFKPQKIHTPDGNYDFWFDGVMSEEVPIQFAHLKTTLEQRYYKKHHMKHKKKLKIFYVSLGARSHELAFMKHLEKMSFLFGKLTLIGKLFDKIMDSHLHRAIRNVTMTTETEVLGVNLQIGRLAILDIASIPYIIKEGRKHFYKEMLTLNQQLKKGEHIKFPDEIMY